jgi:putative intracellular protease/amidase
MKKVLIIVAPKEFRDVEYIVPRAFWEQVGMEVKTASSVRESRGRFGFVVQNDFLIDEVSADDFDGIFFVGGMGSLEFADDPSAKALAESFVAQGKAVGAICAAPRLLLQWGIMEGKKCTGNEWDGTLAEMCSKYGATYVEEPVVVDGNICTAEGPGVAEQTALAFQELLR